MLSNILAYKLLHIDYSQVEKYFFSKLLGYYCLTYAKGFFRHKKAPQMRGFLKLVEL